MVNTLCRPDVAASSWLDHALDAEAGFSGHDQPSHMKAWPLTEAPTTRPVALIDERQPLRHVIHFVDEETPKHAGKPAGIKGVEIWLKQGGFPPTGPEDLTILALDTSTPHTVQYGSAAAGQMAYYQLRWVGQDGVKGPWSELFTALING